MRPDPRMIQDCMINSRGQKAMLWTKEHRGQKAMLWTKEHRGRAQQEGWFLWFLSDHRTGRGIAMIVAKGKGEPKWVYRSKRREERPVRHASDREAAIIVGELADAGAAHAKLALAIIARLVILNM